MMPVARGDGATEQPDDRIRVIDGLQLDLVGDLSCTQKRTMPSS